MDLLLGAVAVLSFAHALGCAREAFVAWYSGVEYEGGSDPRRIRRRLYLHLAASLLVGSAATVAVFAT